MKLSECVRPSASVYSGKDAKGNNVYDNIPVEKALKGMVGRLSFISGVSETTARAFAAKMSGWNVVKNGEVGWALEPKAQISAELDVEIG